MKVAINNCWGGFGISTYAVKWLREQGCPWANDIVLKGERYPASKMFPSALCETDFDSHHVDFLGSNDETVSRSDPWLIKAIEELGGKASGKMSKLKIVEIPDDIEWGIHNYDGMEHVEEKHQTWC